MKFHFLIMGISFQILFIGSTFTHAQQVPSNSIEIIVDGKRYESIRAYRRHQVKDILANTLAVDKLQMFSEKELCEMIKEVRSQQTANTSSPAPVKPANLQPKTQQQDQGGIEGSTLDLSSTELQEMLDGYFKEYKETDPSLNKSDKEKIIIIEPKADSEAIYSD